MLNFIRAVTLAIGLLPALQASARPAADAVGLAKRAVYSCTDPNQGAFASAAYSEAKTLASTAASYIASHGASDALYQQYFGTTPTDFPLWVYTQIANENGSNYTITCSGHSCSSTEIADTAWSDIVTKHSDGSVTVGSYKATTYLCPIFYNRAPLSEFCTTASSGRGDSLVHEMSHALAHTKDYVYGCSNTIALAASNPTEAANNAENYGCFSIAVYKATQCSSSAA